MKKTMPKLITCERKPGQLMPRPPNRSPLPVAARTYEKTTRFTSFPQREYSPLSGMEHSNYFLSCLRYFTIVTSQRNAVTRAKCSHQRTSIRHPRNILELAQKDEGDNKSINSNSFSESQSDEHIYLDQRRGLRIASDRAERLTAGNADADARSDSSQADG